MSKLDLCSCAPVERASGKASVLRFRDRITMALLSALLMVVPAGCASQRAATIAPPNPPASAGSVKSEKEGKGNKKPSGTTLDIRNKKGDKENLDEKEREWEDLQRWINKLRRDPKAYQKCYDNWECDQV